MTANQSTNYNQGIAADMAALSLAAYQDGETLAHTLAELGWTPLTSTFLNLDAGGGYAANGAALPIDNSYAFVATREFGGERQMAVVFRGTDQTSDWVNNLSTYGFEEYYTALRPLLVEALRQGYYSADSIFIAGHSLGGAAAQAAMVDIFEPQDKVIWKQLGIPDAAATLRPGTRLWDQSGMAGYPREQLASKITSFTFGAPGLTADNFQASLNTDASLYRDRMFQFEHEETADGVVDDPVASLGTNVGSTLTIDLADDIATRYAALANTGLTGLHSMDAYQESMYRAIYGMDLIASDTTYTIDQLPTLPQQTSTTWGNDKLVSYWGDLNGGGGNDILLGNHGTLTGGSGDDIYVITQQGAKVTITGNHADQGDRLYLGSGFAESQLSSRQVGSDLLLHFDHGNTLSSDITIKNWYAGGTAYQLSEIAFLNGTANSTSYLTTDTYVNGSQQAHSLRDLGIKAPLLLKGSSAILSSNGRYAGSVIKTDHSSGLTWVVNDLKTGAETKLSFTAAESSLWLYGNFQVESISNDASHILIKTWNNGFTWNGQTYQDGLYWVDPQTRVIQRVDVAPNASYLDWDGWHGIENTALSSDGRTIIFKKHLSTADGGQTDAIFAADLSSGTVTQVSPDTPGERGAVTVSADGRFVCYTNTARPGVESWDTRTDIFVTDRLTNTTTRVNTTAQEQPFGSQTRFSPSMSDDGRWVAFDTMENLSAKDTNWNADIYVKDLKTGAVTLASVDNQGRAMSGFYARISSNGRYVSFQTDLQVDPTVGNLYVRDMVAGKTYKATGSAPLDPGTFTSESVYTMSDDGRQLLVSTWNRYDMGDDSQSGNYYVFTLDAGNDNGWTTTTQGIEVKASTSSQLTKGSQTLTLEDAAASGIGNKLDNLLVGNAADNQLLGKGGNDTLIGGAGNDYLSGGDDNDVLFGGAGSDTLVGGNGVDVFRYDAVSDGGDKIVDFQSGTDTLTFYSPNFGNLDWGSLSTDNFVIGTDATQAVATFLYDPSKRTLSFDADGSGAGAAVTIATFERRTSLGASDIMIIPAS